MSNQVFIQRTIFQNVDEKGNHLDATYGFRVFDDHAAAYDNYVPSLEELNKLSSEDLIERAGCLNDAARDMIDFARENGDSIIVDGKEMNVSGSPKP